jgi:hypothetical protein
VCFGRLIEQPRPFSKAASAPRRFQALGPPNLSYASWLSGSCLAAAGQKPFSSLIRSPRRPHSLCRIACKRADQVSAVRAIQVRDPRGDELTVYEFQDRRFLGKVRRLKLCTGEPVAPVSGALMVVGTGEKLTFVESGHE